VANCAAAAMPFMNEVLNTPTGCVVFVWPFGAIAPIRSLHGITGAAARSDSGTPFGLCHGTSVPSGSMVRLWSAASSSDWPPPYESPGHADALRVGGAVVDQTADQLLRVPRFVAHVSQVDPALGAVGAAGESCVR
jgi:hypothetical protein